MPELTDLNEDSPTKLSRRNVVVGTAWAVPAIALVGAAPAFAATVHDFTMKELPTTNINIQYANTHTNFVVSGTGTTGSTVTVTVSGPSGVPGPLSYTIPLGAPNGDWSVSFPIGTLPDGSLTFTPTSTGATFSPTTRTAVKDTVRPTFTANKLVNGVNRTLSGNVSADATVTLTPARGTITYGTPTGTPPMKTWTTIKYKTSDFGGITFGDVVVSCSDSAGNAASTANITLTGA